MATKTKDYKVTITDQQNEYIFSAKRKNAIYVKGIKQNDIDTNSFRIYGDNLLFSAKGKDFVVSNYTGIKYIKTDNALGKTELLDIISHSYVDNTANVISTYNKKLTVTDATNYNDEIDMSGINNLTKTIKVGKKKQIVDKTSQDKGFTIKSGAGDDIITGSMYSDTITGGVGKNTIIVKNTEFGNDVINLTKNEELVIDLTDCTDITEVSDLKFRISGKNLIITVPNEDESDRGIITLKNYTKNILKSLSFSLYNQDKISYNTFTELTNNIIFDYNVQQATKKGIITTTNYNDNITINNSANKKYTINAGKGNNTINIDNSISYGTVIINEQKVNATNKIVLSNDLFNPSFEKVGNDLKIYDDNGQILIKSYYANVKNKSTFNISVGDKDISLTTFLSEQTTEIIGSGKIYGTDNDDNITITGKKAVTINAGKGDDLIGYAKGNRTIYFNKGDGNDIIKVGGGTDTLVFQNVNNVSADIQYSTDGIANLVITYGENNTVTLEDYKLGTDKRKYYQIGKKKYEISSLISNGENIDIETFQTDYYGTKYADRIIDSLTKTIRIHAGGGNDYIEGYYDDIYGGDDNDYIKAEKSNVYGEAGDDIIVNVGTEGSDYDREIEISGGNGNDTITNEQHATINNIEGDSGNDEITNYGSVTNAISGDEGNDNIINETTGTVSNIDGGEGADIVINKGTVTNIISGGNGTNEITNYGTVSGRILGGDDKDTITNVQGATVSNIDGGNGNNIIINNGTITDSIACGDNNDEITNNGTITNNITIIGGENYIINNGTINGHIQSGDNKDIIDNTGTILGAINAGNGNNKITNNGTVQNIVSGDGQDTITNEINANITDIDCGNGNNIIVNKGNISGSIQCGSDKDVITNIAKISGSISSGNGDNEINNSGTANNIICGSGFDVIVNSGTVDGYIQSGQGNDIITTEEASSVDYILFNIGDGHDTLYLNAGVNNIRLGNNIIYYTLDIQDNDLIISYNDGADSITVKNYVGNEEKVNLQFNESNTYNLNMFVDSNFKDLEFNHDGHNLTITDITNDKKILVLNNFNLSSPGLNIDTLLCKDKTYSIHKDALISISGLHGYSYNTIITVSSSTDSVYGREGNDKIIINSGIQYVYGDNSTEATRDGNDTILINNTVLRDVYGGGGNDTIIVNGRVYNNIYGGSGTDEITNKGITSTIYGGSGNDTIISSSSTEWINAESDDDTIIIESDIKNTILEFNNGDGNDIIYANAKKNTLYFNDFNGLTYMWNETGTDLVLKYNDNKDTITIKDFNTNGDLTYITTNYMKKGSLIKEIIEYNDGITGFENTHFKDLSFTYDGEYLNISDGLTSKTILFDLTRSCPLGYIDKIYALNENSELGTYSIINDVTILMLNKVGSEYNDKIIISDIDTISSVDGQEGNNIIINNGIVNSYLFGGLGNNTIINNGTVKGWINGGVGNNIIKTEAGSTCDLIKCNSGNDTLYLNASVNNLEFGFGLETYAWDRDDLIVNQNGGYKTIIKNYNPNNSDIIVNRVVNNVKTDLATLVPEKPVSLGITAMSNLDINSLNSEIASFNSSNLTSIVELTETNMNEINDTQLVTACIENNYV